MSANVRQARKDDLPALLELFRHLHADDPSLSPDDSRVRQLWVDMLADANLLCFVAEAAGRVVSTCTLTIVPNLTRGMRPYSLIENVVTHPEYRGRGFASAVIRHAMDAAWQANCYKVMLLTGSKDDAVLGFYESLGFARGQKTGFVAWAKGSWKR